MCVVSIIVGLVLPSRVRMLAMSAVLRGGAVG